MSDNPELIELYEELYKLEEKIDLLNIQMIELNKRHNEEIKKLGKELEAQKAYYSGHIKELYSRTQLAVK